MAVVSEITVQTYSQIVGQKKVTHRGGVEKKWPVLVVGKHRSVLVVGNIKKNKPHWPVADARIIQENVPTNKTLLLFPNYKSCLLASVGFCVFV